MFILEYTWIKDIILLNYLVYIRSNFGIVLTSQFIQNNIILTIIFDNNVFILCNGKCLKLQSLKRVLNKNILI